MNRRRKTSEYFWYVGLFLPGFIIFSFAVIYPFLSGIYVSFTDWDGLSQAVKLVGLKNYRLILNSSDFWSATGHSLYFAVLITAASNILSLMIALGLNRTFKGRSIL